MAYHVAGHTGLFANLTLHGWLFVLKGNRETTILGYNKQGPQFGHNCPDLVRSRSEKKPLRRTREANYVGLDTGPYVKRGNFLSPV